MCIVALFTLREQYFVMKPQYIIFIIFFLRDIVLCLQNTVFKQQHTVKNLKIWASKLITVTVLELEKS